MRGSVCTVCQGVKHTLRPRKSKLLPNTTLLLCNGCFEGRKEPRFAIILAGRKNGIDSVSDYIRNHRYVGKDITARELV